MTRFRIVMILLVVAFICALMAGCTTTTPPAPVPTTTPAVPATTPPVPANPTVIIASPANGATIQGSSIPVTIQVRNFNIVDKQGQARIPGEGHVHYYLDVNPVPSDPSRPAIPADANAVWAHVAATSYSFTNVTPGMHTVSVQLANNDHTPVIPLASATVMVTAAGAQATGTPVATTTTVPPTSPTATPTGMDQTVQVALTAQNIQFDKGMITVPAGSTVVVTFNNMDSGVPHNFAVYTDSTASTGIFSGQFVTGPATVTYTFSAPSQPGTYFFRCDVHPTMTGSFIVT